ncbi:50S ribosomal protein L17 [Candidatus Adlerbacteria bacterium RIFCSPLOWO2_01_FULL_51_16]|uniref:50S ribosomal protein L17 n=1 Tax=Candidatus Adlerbacteria bacterium RIFCSPLOWO2_01_FULL_51_16 TaxID=1797243 RepID=A0A1F4XEI6_9BACT|nr:MAG: 50S ribosomal protein L17 [Candidatus Adlerbacteria bacterium RIFCSPLOWO2_01_FULL_51_16]
MKHGKKHRKLGREKGPREALLRSLARSLILRGRIQTTEARAKEIRPLVEKMVTRGRIPTLANRRMLISQLHDEGAVTKLIGKAEGYKTRSGGYLRIVKMGPRAGDAASMAIIEFV